MNICIKVINKLSVLITLKLFLLFISTSCANISKTSKMLPKGSEELYKQMYEFHKKINNYENIIIDQEPENECDKGTTSDKNAIDENERKEEEVIKSDKLKYSTQYKIKKLKNYCNKPIISDKDILGGRLPVSKLNPSDAIINFIASCEGFVGGYPYLCSANVLTIGYGHVVTSKDIYNEGILNNCGISIDKILSKEIIDFLKKKYRKEKDKAIEIHNSEISKKIKSKKATTSINNEKGISLFKKDIYKHVNGLLKWINKPLLQEEYDALLSFVFNLGNSILDHDKCTLTRRLNIIENYSIDNQYDYLTALTMISWFRNASKKINNGLCARRYAEICILSSNKVDFSKLTLKDCLNIKKVSKKLNQKVGKTDQEIWKVTEKTWSYILEKKYIKKI